MPAKKSSRRSGRAEHERHDRSTGRAEHERHDRGTGGAEARRYDHGTGRAEQEREALRARKARKEKNIREQKEAAVGRVSYVKKPLSVRSVIGTVLMVLAIGLGGFCIYSGYATRGQVPFSVGGPALCSILCCLAAIGYHAAAFRERDKNCILAKIGIVVSAAVAAGWAFIIIIGIKGV